MPLRFVVTTEKQSWTDHARARMTTPESFSHLQPQIWLAWPDLKQTRIITIVRVCARAYYLLRFCKLFYRHFSFIAEKGVKMVIEGVLWKQIWVPISARQQSKCMALGDLSNFLETYSFGYKMARIMVSVLKGC